MQILHLVHQMCPIAIYPLNSIVIHLQEPCFAFPTYRFSFHYFLMLALSCMPNSSSVEANFLDGESSF